jgi:large subunit ribosomal protein L21
MYAIVETGGKQYRVEEGSVVWVEKLPAEDGDEVTFDRVLVVANGNDVRVGTPYIEGASAQGKVLRQGKSRKILVFRYKAKSNLRRRYGHRQPYTKVLVEKIHAPAL